MTKRQKAHYKIDRRLGENIWGRAKSPVVKRPYRPGQGGASRRRSKLSNFAVQLHEKQKFKARGDLSERQLKNIVHKSKKQRGDTGQNIIRMIESRLQCVLYWSKIARTIRAARQLIAHGHVWVNDCRVKSPGYLLKAGDTVTLKEKSRGIPAVIESLQSNERDIPEYLTVNLTNMTVQYLRAPTLTDVPYPTRMEPNQLVEYYSR